MTAQTTRRALIGGAGLTGVALIAPAMASLAPPDDASRPDWSAWDATLKLFETEAHAYRDAEAHFTRIETQYFAHKTEEGGEAYDVAQTDMLDCSGRVCAKVRALAALPAPDAAAVLIKAQVALDSGLIGNDDLAAMVASDLRRFTNYANQER
ncbi:hypothetical protein QP150_16320 [Sphingomonas sp. 22L2VL55-3]